MKNIYEIEYELPQVTLLQETGIGTAEIAARTCYDSFDASENKVIKEANYQLSSGQSQEHYDASYKNNVNGIENSDLLDKLAWTHFHHSILEHANLTYLIKGTSRGVLQEHARHRIQAISVRSTRYTMSSVINAFVASLVDDNPMVWFCDKLKTLDLLVTTDIGYNTLEFECIFNKLMYQREKLGNFGFVEVAVSKSGLNILEEYEHSNDSTLIFETLQTSKKKRNVGDAFKHIVTDNWKVDMVVTFNLRSLKNYFTLRDSGAAYFQIRWLAQEMMKVTPSKYLDLIIKGSKDV